MYIRLTPPDGKKLVNIKTGQEYSEVVCDEKKRYLYAVSDGVSEMTSVALPGNTSGGTAPVGTTPAQIDPEIIARLEAVENGLSAVDDGLSAAKILLGVE